MPEAAFRRPVWLLKAALVLTAVAVGLRTNRGSSFDAASLTSLFSGNPTVADVATVAPTSWSEQFKIYKIAMATPVHEAESILELVNATLAYVSENTDFGCGARKTVGWLMGMGNEGPQLHWVSSNVLANDPDPISYWAKQFDLLNHAEEEDTLKFNAFMHNKIIMFQTKMELFHNALVAYGQPTILRTSSGYKVTEDCPTGTLAHVGFTISGRVYEVVGPIPATGTFATTTANWPEWGPSECGEAHGLDHDVDAYVVEFNSYIKNAPSTIAKWAAERGYYPPMLAMISLAVADGGLARDDNALRDMLGSIASIDSYTESSTDECEIVRVVTVSTGGFRAPVRYVYNKLAEQHLKEQGDVTVGDYNDYIQKTHETITGSYENMAGWDHWMDQHIGIEYVGDQHQVCDLSYQLIADLEARNLPVGQRMDTTALAGASLHYYTGYPGPMAWEYNILNCTGASRNNEAGICGCNAANNDKIYYAETGNFCPTTPV